MLITNIYEYSRQELADSLQKVCGSTKRLGRVRRGTAGLAGILLALCSMIADADRAEPAEAAANIALTATLSEFLANVNDYAAHERFWADDLIYTSSAGKRFGKNEILSGMRPGAAEPVDTRYGSENVVIRHFDKVAVVTFRLVAQPLTGDTGAQRYLNTGVFAKRDGRWRAVNWQATKVPPESE